MAIIQNSFWCQITILNLYIDYNVPHISFLKLTYFYLFITTKLFLLFLYKYYNHNTIQFIQADISRPRQTPVASQVAPSQSYVL